MANPNSTRGKRRVEPIKQRLSQVRTTGHHIIHRCIKIPLTYPAFELKMKKPKYGGLSPAQSQKDWKKYQDDPNIKDDQLAIVGGEPGHERLWIPMIEQEIDDNYRKKDNQHITESRSVKRLKASTCDDFLNNKATLSEEEVDSDDAEAADLPLQTSMPRSKLGSRTGKAKGKDKAQYL